MPFTPWLASIALAADEPTVKPPGGFMGTLAHWAEGFIGVFQTGGSFFMALVTGIIPTLVVLLTAVNALIRWIGPEKIERLGEHAAKPGIQYYPIRYLVLPFLSSSS